MTTDLKFLIFHKDGKTLGDVPDMLTAMMFEIVYVNDINRALEIAGGCGSCVGLLDITALGDDGIDILKKIQTSDRFDWLIVLTDANAKASAMNEAGSDNTAFLAKPIDAGELRQLIESVSEVHALRREISDKTRKMSRLEVVNEIARETLVTSDENTLMWKIAHLINEKLGYYNVNIFIVDDNRENVTLRAFAGGLGDDLVAGYSVKVGEGITGWVVENREPLLVGDAKNDPRRIRGFEFEENIMSELGVPIIVNDSVLGVIHVESEVQNAFSREDVIVLTTVADQMAMALENWRLSQELIDAYELSSTINDSLPVNIILIDTDHIVRYVNQSFCEVTNLFRDDILQHPVKKFFSEELVEKLKLTELIDSVHRSGLPICHTNVYHTSPHHPDKILNITIARVQAGKHPRVMILIQDVTDFTIKTRQLSLIREISIAMQGVLERDKLMHMILTSVTAGFAMGFNRAFLFLVDKEHGKLKGALGVGPTSRDEAYRIWGDLSSRSFTFDDYLNDVESGKITRSGLQDIVEDIVFDIEEDDNLLTETVRNRSFIHIVDAWKNPGIDDEMRKVVASNEFVTAPLVAKNVALGVIFADNAYSQQPITEDAIEELSMIAGASALAIENAQMLEVLENQVKELESAYEKLENTHAMLIRHEKLAAIGEVSTRLAHEIRNPLATIGGFAESIPRKYEDRERTIRNANIIIDEVHRLESILTNVLDFTKTGAPQKERTDINAFVKEAVRIMEGNATEHGILIVLELYDGTIESEIDAPQMKQVLINLIQNAFNAMPDGGALALRTGMENGNVTITVRDTGCGIPEDFLENIFDPFFTTRHDGTGLGLSISQRIIQNHMGRLDIESKEDEGTKITIVIPGLP